MIPLILAFAQAEIDVYRLPIGDQTHVRIAPGFTDLKTGKACTASEIAAQCEGSRFLLLGESHDSTAHKEGFAQIIQELVRRGRNVSVGMEMFTRPNQPNLAPWSMGYWSEEEFIEKANWKKEWGFDFSIYRPVFSVVRENKLPLVALNVPRDWVRAVGRGGPDALPNEAKNQVPEINLGNQDHRAVFMALIGGHPMGTEAQMNNMYAGQVLWDTGMADSALKVMESWPKSSSRIMVMIAGSGHALYRQAINYRIQMRTGESVPTLIGIDGEKAMTVNRGIGDWTLLTPAPKRD